MPGPGETPSGGFVALQPPEALTEAEARAADDVAAFLSEMIRREEAKNLPTGGILTTEPAPQGA
jgi:hypothetical protein